MGKVFVLQTIDPDDQSDTIAVYDNLDNAKIAAQAWLVEQYGNETDPPPILEWHDNEEVSWSKNSDDYETQIYIWVRDVIAKSE